MSREVIRSKAALERLYSKVHDSLRSIWQQHHKRRMGIALSGGVDSMALAYLCHLFQSSPELLKVPLTAFIVDHGVRPESGLEAQRARSILLSKVGEPRINNMTHPSGARFQQALGIDVKILKLKWTTKQHPLQLPAFESLARQLRYRALLQACNESQITALLVAHHADDQAETVLSRMHSGYTGYGLQGIATEGDIPECDGLYGCKSGQPRPIAVTTATDVLGLQEQRIFVEDGGVTIHRPLLNFTKEELQQVCSTNALEWVEDQTNHDPTLTIRNAVRGVLRDGRLPKHLSTQSLLALAGRQRAKKDAETRIVEDIFNACAIRLDLKLGSAHVEFPSDIRDMLGAGDNRIERAASRGRAAFLLRRIVELISPQDQVKLNSLKLPTRLAFPFLFSATELGSSSDDTVAPIGKTLFRVSATTEFASEDSAGDSPISCQITRAPPTEKDQIMQRTVLIKEIYKRSEFLERMSTDWQLFDGRFWIRLNYRKFNLAPGRRFVARFLQPSDLEGMKDDGVERIMWKSLKELLQRYAPGSLRFTLPAIIETHWIMSPTGEKKLVEKLIALPTMDWSRAGWRSCSKPQQTEAWTWEVRYKRIDFGKGHAHKFVA